MGMLYANRIEKAADFLLRILMVETRVPYSRFYDGTDETADQLATDMGESDDAEPILDEAAAALADQAYVKITPLDDELADGDQDYEIELSEQGRAMLAAGKRPVFRDLDL